MEYDNPGTKDIYATPLRDLGESNRFQRAGTSSDYNFRNLTAKLEAEVQQPGSQEGEEGEAETPPAKRRRKIEQIAAAFKGKPSKTSEAEAEAIGAISCDFMKGSSAFTFLQEAQKHTEELSSFATVFTGPNPLYPPAAAGGRALVSHRSAQFRMERQSRLNHLVGVNNCLIHAIAQAAVAPDATPDQVLRIRTRLGNPGQMLFAAPENVRIIREELGIDQTIVVHYRLDDHIPNEIVPGSATRIHVYHTGHDHFVHKCPDPVSYDRSED